MIQSLPQPTHKVASGLEDGTSTQLTTIDLVCACDNHYAMPLTVMLHSAASHLGSGYRLQVWFVDGGLSEASWIALRETLADLPIDVWAIQPDYALVEHLHTSHHVTPAAYLRLLTAELLPPHVSRALYLDSDVLVCADLAELWNISLEGHLLAAVPDIACPYVDARYMDSALRKSIPYLAALTPVPNYRELGMNPASPYFNSGVMLIDVDKWRQDQLAARMLECLDRHRDHIWCWDQYALNVVCHGDWKPLSMKWNQGAHVEEFPSSRHAPVDAETFQELLTQPAIVHFTTEFKPWHYGREDDRSQLFLAALDRTAWQGWRPERPPFSMKRFQQRVGAKVVLAALRNWRRLTVAWRRWPA